MAKHKMTERHFVVLMLAQDGETDFGPLSGQHHLALDLLSYKFGEPMLAGVNSRSITGLTKAGEAALASDLAKQPST